MVHSLGSPYPPPSIQHLQSHPGRERWIPRLLQVNIVPEGREVGDVDGDIALPLMIHPVANAELDIDTYYCKDERL